MQIRNIFKVCMQMGEGCPGLYAEQKQLKGFHANERDLLGFHADKKQF